MIRLYPSRHAINLHPCEDGAAIERHDLNEACTIAEWMQRTVEGYEAREVPPISFDVNGVPVPAAEWGSFVIMPGDDVRMYPVPFAAGAAFMAAYGAYIAVAIAVVSLIYAMTLNTPGADSNAMSGDRLELNPARANSVRLYQIIREVLGTDRIFPDYVVQPVSRFVAPRDVRTSLFLCLGVGQFNVQPSRIKIGETPISAFGDEVSYTIYGPGEFVGNDPRSENWFISPEVGASKSATAGLDLTSPTETSSPAADALSLTGSSVTLIGDTAAMPGGWAVGTVINMVVPDSFVVTSGDRSVIAGPLEELAPFPGMQVLLSTRTEDLELVVATYDPYVPPVPGVGGKSSSVTASSAPTTYDFTATPLAWTLSYQGASRNLSLNANYVTMSGIVAALTSQLSGIGLVAQDDSGRLKIFEPNSPYRGGSISQSSAPVAVFGVAPAYVAGEASSGGTPEELARMTLNFNDGQPFTGLPDGIQRLGLGYRQNRYRIDGINGLTLTVSRINAEGAVDVGWTGFVDRTVLDFTISSSVTSDDNWIGPFMGCPEGELVDRLEWDVLFPGGLQSTTKKGGEHDMVSVVHVQYADVTTGAWINVDRTYRANTRDGIGYTEGVNLNTPIRPMVRMRKGDVSGYRVVADSVQWYSLRGRLRERPTRYDDVTIIALTVRTGARLSSQSDRQVSLVATRLYDEGTNRSISGAAAHVARSLGMGADDIDGEQLEQLEGSYWTPRGETCDHTFDEAVPAHEALQAIFGAGMSYLVIEDSMISAVREGVHPAQGMLTPHDQSAELVSTFVAPSADDYTGVDVKYISPVTFVEEVVECRVPGIDPLKIETYNAEAVHDRTRAWRIGMRRLMKYLYQRITHQTETEMDALAYRVLDHLILADDIPGNQTISCVIEQIDIQGDRALITTSEQLDWSFPGPSCVIRWQDGSVTPLLAAARISDEALSVDLQHVTNQFDLIDWEIEPPRLLFCSSSSVGYAVMIDSIEPDSSGRCKVVAKQYSPVFYSNDDSLPPAA